MAYQFTEEDRKKSLAKRRENKASRYITNDELAEKGLRWMLEAWAGQKNLNVAQRIRIGSVLLPYYEAKIRAQDKELDGDDPININEAAVSNIKDRHGEFWNGEDEGN